MDTIALITPFIIIVGYFLPTVIALFRKSPNRTAIGVLNLFLGWTLIGWVVALMMSVWGAEKEKKA